jgi:formamidopyrimidine-DNA glycosylase
LPELPEVETVMRGLAPAMIGQTVESVSFSDYRLRFPYPDGLRQHLQKARVEQLSRRGKYICVLLSNEVSLIVHLGMSGSYRIEDQGTVSQEKHDHMVLGLSNDKVITYNDPRRFGFVDLVFGDPEQIYKPFTKMGPEPLSDEFDANMLYGSLKRGRSSIKQVLLDQSIVAGLGNIYVCEALYRSGIHPTRKAGSVSLARLKLLVGNIRDVLVEAIQSGGSSLKDHKGVDGTMGYFQHHFDVYGREGEFCGYEACRAQSKPCVKRVTQAGRSTFYCVNTQR